MTNTDDLFTSYINALRAWREMDETSTYRQRMDAYGEMVEAHQKMKAAAERN